MAIVHIYQTEPDPEMEWTHGDWFYEIKSKVNGKWCRLKGTRLYKSRSAASRIANSMGHKVEHWFRF